LDVNGDGRVSRQELIEAFLEIKEPIIWFRIKLFLALEEGLEALVVSAVCMDSN
jgi:hypothetical protein